MMMNRGGNGGLWASCLGAISPFGRRAYILILKNLKSTTYLLRTREIR